LYGAVGYHAEAKREEVTVDGSARVNASAGDAFLDAMAARVADLVVSRLAPALAPTLSVTRYATAKNNPLGSSRAFLNAHRDGRSPTFKRGREIAAEWSAVEAWMRSNKAESIDRAAMADDLDVACAAPRRRTKNRSEG
jgi:hypothetical protein